MKASVINDAVSACTECEEDISVIISCDADIAYEEETANKACEEVVEVAPISCPFTRIDPDTSKEPVKFPYAPKLGSICFHLIKAIYY